MGLDLGVTVGPSSGDWHAVIYWIYSVPDFSFFGLASNITCGPVDMRMFLFGADGNFYLRCRLCVLLSPVGFQGNLPPHSKYLFVVLFV